MASFILILVTTILTIFVTYPLGVAVYNVFFHPLRKYPGPVLWTAFRLPFLVSMMSGNLPHDIRAFHDKYGPIVRVAPNELDFTDSRAYADIYQRQTLNRPPQWGGKPPGVQDENLINATVKEHARLKKIMSPAFSDKAVASYEPTVRRYISSLIRKMKSRGPSPVDIVQWINYTTFDIIMDLSWGTNFNCLEEQKYSPWIANASHFQSLLAAISLAFYPWLNAFIMAITPKSALASIDEIIRITRSNMDERIQRNDPSTASHQDIFSYLSKENESSSSGKMTHGELQQQSMTVIMAGSESITSTLSGALNHLLREPKKMAKLTREVRAAFKASTDIDARSTRSLQYLNAVIQESLRLCPPFPDGLRRQLTADTNRNIAGEQLPPGTVVSVAMHSMYHDPMNFSRPTEFLPERWLGASEQTLLHVKDAFHPFGLGARACMGQPLAWMEMRLLLTNLVYHFDLEIAPDVQLVNWASQKIFWMVIKEPMYVVLQPRTGEESL